MTALCRCESATQRPNSIKLPVLIAATLLTTLVPRGLGQENVQQKVQATAQALLVHQSIHESQTAAGGRLSFEVASVRPADPGVPIRSNLSMDIEDTPIPPGGRFSAVSPLQDYIEFAYKIMPTRKQEEAMLAHLPKWVSTDRFDIEAKAEGDPNKDEMRLMLRSLLADRFKLVAHFETHEVPVLALVPDKSGKPGPRLRPHAEGLACDAKWIAPPDRTSPSVAPGGFVPDCGDTVAFDGPNHTVLLGARNITIEQIADYLGSLGMFDRPIVDQTGLSGRFDFSIDWLHERNGPSISDAQLDGEGPTFLDALKEQLGMRLKSTKAQVTVLVIDNVDQPSPN
jgi:uncharacterized protein (TIGR03435 family)